MNVIDNPHPSASEVGADAFEAVGIGLRIIEVGLVTLVGLLVCPPLFILATVVAVPALAVAVLLTAIAAVIAVPTLLVRRVLAHHREHRSTLFVHRLRRHRRPHGAAS